ncbi:MAG: kinase [Veillonellaceae bacterium]|nr:kinase [Veillonellaceae bacterium]
MIISKTPLRMSFFGGGTDMPAFFNIHRGAVISTTFDKYSYVSVRHLPRFFDYSNQVSYSRIEKVNEISEIQNPAVRETMRLLDMRELIISYDADLPARTGLASSSSFVVGMLHAFHSLKGRYASRKRLADEAIHVERDMCAEAGGWQDQIAVAFGGMNRIDFSSDGYEVHPIIIDKGRKKLLNDNLMLYYTGVSRFSAKIQDEAQKHLKDKEDYLIEMLNIVDEAEKVLVNRKSDIDEFGTLLDHTWRLKRQLSDGISTSFIDEIYERAKAAGALGGKLLGAGGGGFLLLYVRQEQQPIVRQALKDLLLVPFRFENNGTEIIYYDPEEYPPAYQG